MSDSRPTDERLLELRDLVHFILKPILAEKECTDLIAALDELKVLRAAHEAEALLRLRIYEAEENHFLRGK